MLNSQDPEGRGIRSRLTFCPSTALGKPQMASLRWFPYLSNRDNKSNFSPCLPSSVAMDRCQVSRAPEGGRANRMRVELEVQGEEGCRSPGLNRARGGNFSERVRQQVCFHSR